jgi:hypothetical protein
MTWSEDCDLGIFHPSVTECDWKLKVGNDLVQNTDVWTEIETVTSNTSIYQFVISVS